MIIDRETSKKFKKAKNINFLGKKIFTSIGVIIICLSSLTYNTSDSIIIYNDIDDSYYSYKVEETEEQKLIKKYCEKVYGLKYETVYQIAEKLTGQFKSKEYLETNNPGYKINKKYADTKEQGIVMFVRHLYQKPQDFGVSLDDIKDENFISPDKGNEEYKVKYYSDLFGIDPVLVLAIEYQEASQDGIHYNSKAYLESNNPGGLMNPSTDTIWEFPSPDAGIIEHVYQLRNNYISKGLLSPRQIKESYAPDGVSNDINNLNKYWISGVESFIKEIEEDMSVFDSKEEIHKSF